MIKSYINIAIRRATSQKTYTIINVLGLVIAMTVAMLIFIYVQYELSYDRYHKNADQIYRLSIEWFNDDGESTMQTSHIAPPYAHFLKNDYPNIVENSVRFCSGFNPIIEYGEKRFVEENFFFADSDVLGVFSWSLVKGNPKTVLQEPNSIILTESTAQKYFGRSDVLDEVITFKNFGRSIEMKVTGIVENIPNNSHFQFEMLSSMVTLQSIIGDSFLSNWGSNNYATYLKLPNGYELNDFENIMLPEFIERHHGDDFQGTSKLHLIPLTSIHLDSKLASEIQGNGNIEYVYAYIFIAIFILAIACINFINLSTAKYVKSAKEVGVRKVMGAVQSSIVGQYIVESILFALISSTLAMGLVVMLLSWFSDFTNRELTLYLINPTSFILFILFIVLVVGLLAGSYPAFYFASLHPIKVLKGAKARNNSRFNLRSGLVVFQFSISTCFIIALGVVGDQIGYMKAKELGFEKDHLWVLPMSNQIRSNFGNVRDRLITHSSIEDVTYCSRIPSERLLDSQRGEAEVNGEMIELGIRIAEVHVDHNFIEALSINFLSGRNFSREVPIDSSEAFILNKAATEGLGFASPQNALGKRFNYGGRTGQVIGVIEDFHFESLHHEIIPMVFLVANRSRVRNVVVKIKEGEESEAFDYLKSEWEYLRPGYLFDYFALAKEWDNQYIAEEKLGKLMMYFSAIAIFVAIIGLVGLSSYSIEQNAKEIGIRKVFGASVKNVILIFTSRFARLVILGIGLAIPITIYGMAEWLQKFQYTTVLKPATFILGGCLALALALCTVSYQIIKAAIANPVKILRTE